MPRPKRSKVTPSAPVPRVARPTKPVAEAVPEPPAREAVFNDKYDVSDPDEEVVTCARRVKRDSGKGKVVVARGQGSAKRANARDLEREDSLSEPGENRLGKGRDAAEDRSGGAGIDRKSVV